MIRLKMAICADRIILRSTKWKLAIPQQRQIRILSEGHQVQTPSNRWQESELQQGKNERIL